MLAEIPEEQVRAAIEAVAGEILAEGEVAGPPVEMTSLARRLGIVIASDGPSAGTRARFVRLGGGEGGQATILLADDPRPERRQWAIAHEIGESYAHRAFEELGVRADEAPPGARERVANRLAGCLLLPRDWFLADGHDVDWDLYELKARYTAASHEMIARRMLEASPGVIVTLCDHGKRVWRKSNRRLRTPPMTAAEIDAWKTAHELGVAARCETGELPEGIEDIRAWAVHESHWKREIVRTALAEAW